MSNYKIQKLSKELSMLGFEKEAVDVSKLSNTNSPQGWEAVLLELDRVDDGGLAEVTNMIFPSLKDAGKASQGILKYDPKDIDRALRLSKEIPGLKVKESIMELDNNALLKLSKFKDIDSVNYKTAEESSTIFQLVKRFGKPILRILPIVGWIASFAFAFKNFIYGTAELVSILNRDEIDKLNLNCGKFNQRLCALLPGPLAASFEQNKNNPQNLKILADITKKSKYFADETISFGINSADFVKDVLFVVPSFVAFITGSVTGGLTWGWLAVDVGISLIFMLAEHAIESVALSWWDQTLDNIRTTAENNIRKAGEVPEGIIQKKYTEDELREWWEQQNLSAA